MIESDSAMVRISLLNQHMTVEATHLLDGKYADAAKGAGSHRQDFSFRQVGSYDAITVTLQTVEGNGACCDIALERSAGEIGIASFRLEQPMLNQLILDRAAVTHLAAGGITAVEAHEGIGELVLASRGNAFLIEVFRHGIFECSRNSACSL